jgi:endogenous inhibitor of DNA gyrase (YacG/DUF329 family)
MRRICPVCGRPVAYRREKPLPKDFPFCSERCRLIDLGKWLDGEYSISRPLTPTEKLEEMERGTAQREDGREGD